jgi:hypothetical protein
MNTKVIIWILGILAVTILGAVLWYFVYAPKAVAPPSAQPTTLPVSGTILQSSSTPATVAPGEQAMSLAAQGGKTLVVKDFIHNGVTISDGANAGRYLLAGNLGYCFSDPRQCQAAPATSYGVYYNSGPESFTISLTKEPIGHARLDMEQFMIATLGITQEQMCNLNYLVGVTKYVSEQFAGKNLGFSFCPGATVLPK